MNYEIVEMELFSGSEAKIYSIIPEGESMTIFDRFVENYKQSYKTEIKDILDRLSLIGNNTGAREGFFKSNEGEFGDFVSALFDKPNKSLRIYCIRYGMIVVILGGGGAKPKGIRAWQNDKTLSFEAQQMIDFAKKIHEKMDAGEIFWSSDKTELQGNLKIQL